MYSQEQRQTLIADLCDHIANGGTFREWSDRSGNPSRKTVLTWLEENEDFRNQYTRAYELQADYFAEEIIAIADDDTDDWTIAERTGNAIVNETAIARARLQVETRKWIMGKRKPKVYGDKQSLDLTTGGKPFESLTDEERIARAAALFNEARARRAGQTAEG